MDMGGLVEGKAGLVTGSAGGIGRATAITLAREGASVIVTDLPARSQDGEETVRIITDAGGTARWIPGDVTVEADAKALVDATVEAYGRIDFAHNNAGIELQASVTGTTEAEWDAVMTVNVKGVWLGLKHQIERMVQQGGGGAIVNTASLAGLMAVPTLAAYIASKHAVVGLTKAAAIECAPHDIRVNAVCPAAIATAMIKSLPRERQLELMAPQAIKRIGEPEEVAETVTWLVSDRASFVTGVSMPVDAGAMAQ
jgi:NAD(P)-dependent dehydrogenase (short-subunit alcohol dehydrogenase family)